MIVAIEGIDGAGKSHLSQLLSERLRSASVRVSFVEKHSLDFGDGFAGRRMGELRGLIWPSEPEPSHDALGTEFYLFLLAAWFAGLRQTVPAQLDNYDVLLTDGSYYRVIAKAYRRSGFDLPWLESLFAQALRPDLVVLLDIDPADAWHRRPSFKATELGRWDGYSSDARTAFCSYQASIRETLLELAARHGWLVLNQTAQTAPAETAEQAELAVMERLRLDAAHGLSD